MYKRVQLILTVLIFFAVGCQKSDIENQLSPQALDSSNDSYVRLKGATISKLSPEGLERINKILASDGFNYRVAMAEMITTADDVENMGHLVIAKDVGSKKLNIDFVPGDPRRKWSGESATKITYAIDQTEDAKPAVGALTAEEATEAIDNAFKTWNNVKRTKLGLTKIDAGDMNLGVVSGVQIPNDVLADIQMAGWEDVNFKTGVLGVTYTFLFVDNEGNPTDINNDKKYDAAFREIYFNPAYSWSNDGVSDYDVETIALHEIGHGLSQGHFGTVFIDKNDELKVLPRAVMNAYYLGTLRELQKNDIGGHSSIWASWPNK
ncbi:MAG: hypothetical protein R2757_17290 [Draconibacterium sp.]